MASAVIEKGAGRVASSHKYVHLRQLLDRQIQLGRAGDPLPSYTQLREEYKVSQSTADRVLQELVAQGRVERVHGKGIFISQRAKQKTVALVFGDHIDGVMSCLYPRFLVDSCRAHSLANNQRFLTYFGLPTSDEEADTDPSLREVVNAIRSRQIDGIVYGGHGMAAAHVGWLVAQGVPVVSASPLSISSTAEKFASVRLDRRELVRLGLDALARQSCRNIGLISNYALEANSAPDDTEYSGSGYFKQALEERGLTYNPDWVWDGSQYQPRGARHMVSLLESQGVQALSNLWRTLNGRGQRLDGVVVTDDFLTRGCLFGALKLGLIVGQDIKIATHANRGSDALIEFEDAVSLMEIDADEMASASIQTLALMMQGQSVAADTLVRPRLKLPLSGASRAGDSTVGS